LAEGFTALRGLRSAFGAMAVLTEDGTKRDAVNEPRSRQMSESLCANRCDAWG
jgi:hypothetical protein